MESDEEELKIDAPIEFGKCSSCESPFIKRDKIYKNNSGMCLFCMIKEIIEKEEASDGN